MLYGIYINDDHYPFTLWILRGLKVFETRNRNMLGKLLGHRVAIISTSRKRKPLIVGYATITEARHVTREDFEIYRGPCMIEKSSKYDCTDRGKWLYRMSNVEKCKPQPLPGSAIKHGRSYCELPGYYRIEEA